MRSAVKDGMVEAACALAVRQLDRRTRSPGDLDREEPVRILLIRTDRIGDLMCCSPLIAAFHARWPRAEITLVGGPGNRAAMPLFPYLRRSPVDFERRPASWTRLRAWLPRQGFDLAVSLRSELFAGAWMAARSRAPVRVVANVTRTLPAFNLVLGPNDLHQLRRYWRAAASLGVAWPDARPVFEVPDDARRWADAALRALDLPPGRALVGLAVPHRGGGRRHRARGWPEERLADRAARLSGAGARVLLFGFGVERIEAERIRARVAGVRVVPEMSLAQSAALQRRLDVYISGFTGPLHLADGAGTPTVALGLATDVEGWRPLGPRHLQVVAASVPAILVDDVERAVRSVLGERLPTTPAPDANRTPAGPSR